MAVPINPPPSVKPYKAWNRLESRPRTKEFGRVLKAEVHDPLWMLGRQWQMGEFKGDDAGSGIFARAQMDYFRISGVALRDQAPEPYSGQVPLEPIVESVHHNWSRKERIVIGKKWLQLLKKYATLASFNSYSVLFSDVFSVDDQAPSALSSDQDILYSAEIFGSKKQINFIHAISLLGPVPDGISIFEALVSPTWALDLKILFGLSASTAVITGDLNSARTALLNWIDNMYHGASNRNTSWKNDSLDYAVDTYWRVDPNNEIRLSAPKYHHGQLDWYAFNQQNQPASAGEDGTIKALQIILNQNRFPGMPNSRWWQFENGNVNFTKIDADTTDIAKIILTQFALVYQDDWFVIPYKVPVGAYAQVQGLVVTDVFGVNTFIANYPIRDYLNTGFSDLGSQEWKSWRWLDLTMQTSTSTMPAVSANPASAQVILPTLTNVTESKPIESVVFVRDEVSGMVWAIEKRVPDGMGKGEDGFERANAVIDYLTRIKANLPSAQLNPIDQEAAISYKLSNSSVPENCIPFIPISTGSSNRSIKFQRAALPRFLDKFPISLIRPRTELLRSGLNGVYDAFYVNEEEITKAGVTVETTMQRGRWYDGKVVSWVGRRKLTGRTQASLQLTYDQIEDIAEEVLPELPSPPVPNPIAWYMPDRGLKTEVNQTTANTEVTEWLDQSGAGHDLLSTVLRPIYHSSGGANNLPYVEFTGQQGLSDLDFAIPISRDITVFAVFKSKDGSSGMKLCELTTSVDSNNDGFAVSVNNGSNNLIGVSLQGDAGYSSSSGSLPFNAWNYIRGEAWKSKASNEASIHLTGGLRGTAIPFGIQNADNSNDFATKSTLFVGSRADSTQFLVGELSELILYGRFLTTVEITAVETYLRGKYAIGQTIPAAPVTGPVGWWMADAGVTTDKGRVTIWADQSGGGNHLTAASTALKPLFNSTGGGNGKPSLLFDGNRGLQFARLPLGTTQNCMVFCVVKSSSNLSSGMVCQFTADSDLYQNGFSIRLNHPANTVETSLTGNVGKSAKHESIAQNVWFYTRGELLKGNNIDEALPFVNSGPAGTLLPFGSINSNNTNAFAAVAPLYIGSKANRNEFFTGEISEVLIYNRALSPSEIATIESYLSVKYGILPALPQLPISGAVGWWKADAGITLTGSQVNQWRDQSGVGNHFIINSAIGGPQYFGSGGSNGTPYLDFTGSSALYVPTFLLQPATKDVTIFVVFKNTNSSITGVVLELTVNTGSNNNGFYIAVNDGANDVIGVGLKGDVGWNVASNPIVPNQWSFVRTEGWKNTGPGLQETTTTVNGGPAGVLNPWGTAIYNNNNDFAINAPLYLGTRGSAPIPLRGQISEIIIFPRALSSSEIQSIESYLSNRYQIPVYVAPVAPIVNADGWWRADAGVTTIGSTVDMWRDYSGKTNHLTAPNVTARPNYLPTGGPNNMPCLDFTGSTSLFNAVFSLVSTVDITIFAVMKNMNNSTARIVMELSANTNSTNAGFFLCMNNTVANSIDMGVKGDVSYSLNYNIMSLATWSFVRAEGWKSRTTAEAQVFVNGGTSSGTQVLNANNNSGNTYGTALPLYVGSRANSSVYFIGQISELIIYGRTLLPAEITSVQNYLKSKYNL